MKKRDQASILRKGANILAKQAAMHKGSTRGVDGVCALGACALVIDPEGRGRLCKLTDGFLSANAFSEWHALRDYNDSPNTTKEDVIRYMRQLAYRLEHGGKTYA